MDRDTKMSLLQGRERSLWIIARFLVPVKGKRQPYEGCEAEVESPDATDRSHVRAFDIPHGWAVPRQETKQELCQTWVQIRSQVHVRRVDPVPSRGASSRQQASSSKEGSDPRTCQCAEGVRQTSTWQWFLSARHLWEHVTAFPDGALTG